MSQPLLIGLMTGLFTLSAAVLALIGVLVTTRANFKLGTRTGDVQQQTVGVQQQTVDVARIEKLVRETEDLRKEIQGLWDANRQLRKEFELAGTQHEGERDGWDVERRALKESVDALQESVEAQRTHIARQSGEITRQSGEIARLTDELDTASVLASAAQAAQERAEGGLATAMKTIAGMCPHE